MTNEGGEAVGGEGVFPDAGDLPAFFSEEAGDLAVAGLVAGEFGGPEGLGGGGECAVGWAGVAEAGVDHAYPT